jgi:hypothetical protein
VQRPGVHRHIRVVTVGVPYNRGDHVAHFGLDLVVRDREGGRLVALAHGDLVAHNVLPALLIQVVQHRRLRAQFGWETPGVVEVVSIFFAIFLNPRRRWGGRVGKRTNGTLVRGQHPRSGQTLQHEHEIIVVNDVPAAGHSPKVLHQPATCGCVELHELLLERELRDGRELAVKLDVAARLEARNDTQLPCDHPPTT